MENTGEIDSSKPILGHEITKPSKVDPSPINYLSKDNIDNGKKAEKPDTPEKELWQITRDEFLENYYLHGTTEDKLPKIKKIGGITKGTFIKVGADRENVTVAYATGSEVSGHLTRVGRGTKNGAVLVSKLDDIISPEIKEAMIKKQLESKDVLENPEFIFVQEEEKRVGKYKTIIPIDVDPHRYLIEQAIKEGKNIPIEVLRDYPDIALKLVINLPPHDTTGSEYQWGSISFLRTIHIPEICTTEKIEYWTEQFLKKFQGTKDSTWSFGLRTLLDELEFRANNGGRNKRNWQFETPKKEYFKQLKDFLAEDKTTGQKKVDLTHEKSFKNPVKKIVSFFNLGGKLLNREKQESPANVRKEFNPEELIGNLKRDFNLSQEYASQVGVWEGYTLEQHTLMVMKQYERYFSESMDSSLLSKNEFRMLLALHDMGKARAIILGQDKTKQHEHNKKIIPAILRSLGIEWKKINLMTEVASQDHIGSYMQGKVTAEEAVSGIRKMSTNLGVDISQLLDILQIYYMSDASSYTVDAGGKQSDLDRLFQFKRADGKEKGKVDLSEAARQRMTLLNERVLAA